MAYNLNTQPTFQLMPGQLQPGDPTIQPVIPPGGNPIGDMISGNTTSSQPGQQTAPSSAQDWSTGPWDAQRVNSYFNSRGVTPNPTSADYWAGKWQEWGQNDPAYFLSRLSTADEFTGGKPSGGSGGGTSMSMAGFTPGSFSAPAYNPSAALAGAPGGADASKLFQTLMQRAQQSEVVDPNDPILKSQTNAFDAAQQRAGRNYLSSLAERVGGNANIGAERRMVGEKEGQATAGFQAQLMANELTARRQEIQQALSGAQGLLTSEQQMQLADELAKLDSAQRAFEFTQGGAQQESQFARSLAERGFEFDTGNYNSVYA